jgi:orotidine-5'-phosphate decarboxylase
LSAPIALALDAPDLETAIAWAKIVDGQVSTLKIGLETYLRDGLHGVRAIQAAAPNCQLFLDLKLHDIPNTVAGACRSISVLNPKYLTVHALGGAEMVSKAAEALPGTLITAVTVLTSMDQDQLSELNLGDAAQLAMGLARVAVAAGARALVCSPHEDLGDQKRVSTPGQALADGADLLVIGRPITGPWKRDGVEGVAAALGNVLSHLRSYNE